MIDVFNFIIGVVIAIIKVINAINPTMISQVIMSSYQKEREGITQPPSLFMSRYEENHEVFLEVVDKAEFCLIPEVHKFCSIVDV